MSNPAVSVVMAVHNGAKYVRLAIESVLTQDLRDLEFVIIDDGSTDTTPEIIASFNDPRVVYVRNATNLGQTASLNVGLARARADLVARIDADDIYLPGKLSRQVALMQAQPGIAVCGTAALRIDADGGPIGKYLPPVRPDDVRFTLCQRVPVCHVSVVMRRQAILAVGGYDERYKYAADYALWSVLARSGAVIANLSDELMLYREFVQSLGAVHKLGVAGDESAAILRENLAALAGLSISEDEARAIALLYFPLAGLSSAAIAGAYVNLRHAARRIYGGIPWRVRLELASMLAWSLLKSATEHRQGRVGARPTLGRTALAFWRYPVVAASCAAAAVGSRLGDARIQQWKEAVMPLVLRWLR
jgi:glycosyltransferase involved in cell wall biosynthesis